MTPSDLREFEGEMDVWKTENYCYNRKREEFLDGSFEKSRDGEIHSFQPG